jgi:hypothetical protein
VHPTARRAAFWFAVAAVAIGANVAWEIAGDKVPYQGFKNLVAYSHKGNN